MPIKQSPKKYLRQSRKRRARNRGRKTAIKKLSKKMEGLLEKGRQEEARKLLPAYQKAVDKAGKNRVIHPNKAARLKSKMVRRIGTS